MKQTTPTARRVLMVAGALLIVSWALFATVVLPGGYQAGTSTFGVGLAVTAFVLGMRHAFDADHIAAIDNTSRKLVDDGKDPSSVGLWFALGHSTVVLAAVGLVTAGVGALTSQIGAEDSPLALFTGVWGPTVSSVFLLSMATANLVILVRVLRRARAGGSSGVRPLRGGAVSLVITRTAATLDAPWKMFVVGVLFGLGFDTASTITLLLIAGGAGVVMPWYAAMVLPLLFTAGMVTCDGINSIITARLYRWSADSPERRSRYNAALILLSVGVAFIVGTVGLCGVLVDSAGVRWAPVEAVAATNLDSFGLIIAAMLLIGWLTSWIFARSRHEVTA
ncbi:HoxN/HupN/NixA family nickel/cobalt transporter [Microbacterium trichothecenolyticum]|uniref:HoxN/HupN/NixA family nickel/cobalt transporter n=1 Tax=Microbacterium trichothecenolyticum TaxID=69370 RepID=UPI001C6F0A5D|nr:HoxN/HupN/NixA family nickel/cobalt transporter [Microbacterium trichothecenolyticum]MBW9118789.1 HoxN/HupN/NixA family nickel/cobalt transporter [Microbacterium trichothecenolyticum]